MDSGTIWSSPELVATLELGDLAGALLTIQDMSRTCLLTTKITDTRPWAALAQDWRQILPTEVNIFAILVTEN